MAFPPSFKPTMPKSGGGKPGQNQAAAINYAVKNKQAGTTDPDAPAKSPLFSALMNPKPKGP